MGTRGGRGPARQSITERGEFRFALPVGEYRLVVRGDGPACADRKATVTASSDRRSKDQPNRWEAAVHILIVAREQTVIARVASLLRQQGFDASGVSSDEEAVARLESGAVEGLVIGGGVPRESRRRLRTVAEGRRVPVVRGALAGKDPEVYVRDELAPQLRVATGAE